MTEFVEMKNFFLDVFSKNDVNLNSILPLLESCAVFKHPCYISEREKRIVLFDFTPRASESKFRVSNGRIIPFREIKLPITSIKEIIIGPCADKELNKVSIEMQLAAITHLMRGISIENSELPYRQV